VTLAFAHRLDPLNVDALVRADGNDSSLNLLGFPPHRRAGERREVVLIDFGDEHDETAREATRRRLDGYSGKGWEIEAAGRWLGAPQPQADDDRTRRSRKTSGSRKRSKARSKPS
jgi:hypothetical protein